MSKGSGIGGCLHGAVTLALAAGLGYNAYQVIRLRGEVEALKKVRSQRPAASVGQQATGPAGSGRVSPQDIEKLVGSLSQKAGALWEQDKEGKRR